MNVAMTFFKDMCQTDWFKGTKGRLKSGYFTVMKYF